MLPQAVAVRSRVLWLAERPSSYNSFLFERITQSTGIDLKVWYAHPGEGGVRRPPAESGVRFLRRRFGVDWGLVRAASSSSTDAVFVAGWDDPTKLLAMAVRGARRLPFYCWTDTINTRKGLMRWSRDRVLKRILSRASAVLTTGEVGVAVFRASSLWTTRTPVLSFPFWVPLPNISKRSYCRDGAITFLCVGRLVPRKGLDIVLQGLRIAVSRTGKAVRLNIAGAGPEEVRLKQMARDLGIADQVQFLGWLGPAELESVRQESDVLVHVVPELDPFPVAVLEAMASGLPVIGSALAGSVVERVTNGVQGLVVERPDPHAVARAMGQVIDDPERVVTMGAAARAVAEQWPVERGVALISGLVESRRSGRTERNTGSSSAAHRNHA